MCKWGRIDSLSSDYIPSYCQFSFNHVCTHKIQNPRVLFRNLKEIIIIKSWREWVRSSVASYSVHWVGLCMDDLKKLVKKLSVLHADLCMVISTNFRYAEETWKTPVDLPGTVCQLWSCCVREILWVLKRYASLVLGEYDKEHVQKLLKCDLHFLLLTDI